MMDRIQPVALGPVGQNNRRRPVGTEGMFLVNDLDRPTADGPVGQFITHSPVGPVAVDPVDQPFTTGPVGNHVRVSDYKLLDRIDVSPVGSTGILDPVKQKSYSDRLYEDRHS